MDIYAEILPKDNENYEQDLNINSMNIADYAILSLSNTTNRPKQKQHEEEMTKLKTQLADMTEKMRELLQMNEKKDAIIAVLKRNISSLFKTAKCELERREKQLNEERSQNLALVKTISELKQKSEMKNATSIISTVETLPRNSSICDDSQPSFESAYISQQHSSYVHNSEKIPKVVSSQNDCDKSFCNYESRNRDFIKEKERRNNRREPRKIWERRDDRNNDEKKRDYHSRNVCINSKDVRDNSSNIYDNSRSVSSRARSRSREPYW